MRNIWCCCRGVQKIRKQVSGHYKWTFRSECCARLWMVKHFLRLIFASFCWRAHQSKLPLVNFNKGPIFLSSLKLIKTRSAQSNCYYYYLPEPWTYTFCILIECPCEIAALFTMAITFQNKSKFSFSISFQSQ